jgi:hypothetical protein
VPGHSPYHNAAITFVYYVSVLSRVEGDNQKMNVLKFDSNGTLKFSERDGAEWGGGNSWLRHLPVGYRSHFLPKNFELLPRLSVLRRKHGIYLWSFHNKLTRHGVVLVCLIVWLTVSLIVTSFSSRLQIMVRIELFGKLSTPTSRPFPLPFVLCVPFCYVRPLSVAQLWVKLRTVETWY